jgi:FkbM family methyltransferase
MLYFPHDYYIGGALERYGEYAEIEFELLAKYIKPGHVVIEAGANIGTHTVPLAKLVGNAGRVLAFEPQRIINQMLCGNLAINAIWNVSVQQVALSDRIGMMAVPPVDYSAPGNFGAVSLSDYEGEPVAATALDSYELRRCDFIKMDIEGMEEVALKGAAKTIAKFRPILFIENDRKEKSAALIEAIKAMDYDLWWAITPLFNQENFKQNAVNEYGEVASFNMLCLPSELEAFVQLPPVDELALA